MSSINRVGDNAGNQLKDLYQKRKEVDEQHRDEIDELKNRYKKETETVKQKLDTDVERLEADGDKKREQLNRETKTEEGGYKQQKEAILKSGKQEIEQLKKYRENQIDTFEKRNEQLEQSYKEQAATRTSQEEQKLQALRLKLKEEINKSHEQQKIDLENVRNAGNERLKSAQKAYMDTFTKQGQEQQARVKGMEESFAKETNQLSDEHDKQITDVKTKTKQDVFNIVEEGKKRTGIEKEKNSGQLRTIENNFKIEKDGRQDAYNKTLKQVTDQHDNTLKEVKTDYKQQMDRELDTFEQKKDNVMKAQNEKYAQIESKESKRIESLKGMYQSQIQEQKGAFTDTYEKNDQENRFSLFAQQKRLTDELLKIQEQHVNKIDSYSEKAEDPFYRLSAYETSFSELPDEYLLKVKVPEYNIKDVSVKVHDKKLVLNASRRFEDKMNREGHVLSTNSYQTFVETFPFEHPVDIKNTLRSYEDGMIKIRVPRLK